MSVRSAREPLSLERVVEAATSLADAEGLRVVTMRRVADELDCEAMSLYYYVRDKDSLLTALTESVVGEICASSLHPSLAEGVSDWREVVRRRCLAARRVMLRHPWAPRLVAAQPTAPSTAYALFEALVETMVDGGCTYPLAHRAIHALGSMLLGFTQELFEPDTGDAEVSAEEMAALELAMPHLARIAEVAAHESEGSLSVCDTQAEFEFTMGLVLDGLDAHRLRAQAPIVSGTR
ncbi:MAG: TetR/AcrR family transcriptional regulator [Propionibacteriaceae bacterium]